MSASHHIALYRKYRPQTFDDVVGQEKIVTLLTTTIAKKAISHAYLFCGGRGTGKTTVARIFARDIGCNPEDIIEIDAASNRGIDEIRELREAVRTSPFSSPYKVYIIDEAHMLTKEAANALLKTLEEPPAHVVFILATTDPDKLPETIVSRCQKLVFEIPEREVLADRLVYVAKKEGKQLSKNAAFLLADHGKGSYRDALGMLEQVLVTAEKEVTDDIIISFLGVAEEGVLFSLAEAIALYDLVSVASLCGAIEKQNKNALHIYDDFVEFVRQGLLGRFIESDSTLVSLAKKYPYMFSSKTLITLLEYRNLLLVSKSTSFAAFQAIMIKLTEKEE